MNHYLTLCGKIEYLLVCIPCGRSLPALPGRGQITDVFSELYLLFALENLLDHIFDLRHSDQSKLRSLDFCDQREILPRVTGSSTRGQVTLNYIKTLENVNKVFSVNLTDPFTKIKYHRESL